MLFYSCFLFEQLCLTSLMKNTRNTLRFIKFAIENNFLSLNVLWNKSVYCVSFMGNDQSETLQIYRDLCSQLILNSFLCRFVEVLLPLLFVTTLWGFFMTLSSIELIFDFSVMNLLAPLNDQERISPYNISAISSRQVMRIKSSINKGIISKFITKFSN